MSLSSFTIVLLIVLDHLSPHQISRGDLNILRSAALHLQWADSGGLDRGWADGATTGLFLAWFLGGKNLGAVGTKENPPILLLFEKVLSNCILRYCK